MITQLTLENVKKLRGVQLQIDPSSGKLIHGHFIADVVPIFGMINMIGGECDK